MRLFFSRSSFVRLSVVESAPEALSRQSRFARSAPTCEPAYESVRDPSDGEPDDWSDRGPDSGPLASVTFALVPTSVAASETVRSRRVMHAPPSVRRYARHHHFTRDSVHSSARHAPRRRSVLLPAFRRPLPVREAPVAAEVETPLAARPDVARFDPEADDEPRLAIEGETVISVGKDAPLLTEDISDKQLRRRVLGLALPSIGEQVLALGVGVSDTFLSGHLTSYAEQSLGYDRATAVAAVGVAGTMTWVIITVFLAVNVGVTALVARAIGSRNRGLADHAAAQGVVLGFLIGLVMIGLSVPLADVILAGLGVTGQVAVLAAQFVRVVSLGYPFTGAASAATAAMRGAGDTRRPLLVMMLVNGVNVVASWTLLNGLPQFGIHPLGVIGSAVGAATGWTLGLAMALYLLSRRHPRAPRLQLRLMRPQRELIARILRVGLPSAAEISVLAIGVLTFGREVIGLGDNAYAAYTTMNTVENLGSLPCFGFAVAATALVGQALGAKSPQLAVRVVWTTLQPCLVIMVVVGVIVLAIPNVMLGLFVADPTVIAAGSLGMRVSFFTLTALAFSYVFNGALRGAGDTKFPVVVRAAGTWGFRLPISLLLIPLFALPGARICMALDFWVQAGLSYWRFRSGKWRTAKV